MPGRKVLCLLLHFEAGLYTVLCDWYQTTAIKLEDSTANTFDHTSLSEGKLLAGNLTEVKETQRTGVGRMESVNQYLFV